MNQKFEELRSRAERLLENSNTDIEGTVFPQELNELIHELEVHQIELEMQHAELKNAHQQLAQQRQKYLDLFDFAPVGYVVIDQRGIIRIANLTLAGMLGVARTDLENISLAKYVSTADKDRYYVYRQKVFQQEKAEEGRILEIEMTTADDKTFPARLTSSILQDLPQVRLTITDISDQKAAEQKIQENLTREKKLNELKDRLLETISHEFRTPLTVILNSIGLLTRFGNRLNTTKRDEQYHRIRTQAWHLSNMVSEIAAAQNTQDESISLNMEEIDLKTTLDSIFQEFTNKGETRVSGTVEPADGEHALYTDKDLFRQIITTLLSNGLQYSKKEVHCRIQSTESKVVLQIVDHGVGIPPEDREHIYDLFFRGQNVTTIPGTGIGLAIVKRAVEALAGEITVSTEIDEGTTFTVQLSRQSR